MRELTQEESNEVNVSMERVTDMGPGPYLTWSDYYKSEALWWWGMADFRDENGELIDRFIDQRSKFTGASDYAREYELFVRRITKG